MLCNKIEEAIKKEKKEASIQSYDNRKEVVSNEKQKKFTLLNKRENPKTVLNISIDGDTKKKDYLLPKIEKQRRCDALMIVCEDKTAYFIELKGTHFKDGCEQIEHSLEYFKGNNPFLNLMSLTSLRVRIICKGVPSSTKNALETKLIKKIKECGFTVSTQTVKFTGQSYYQDNL